MAPSPQEDGWGNNVFALGGFTVENLGGGKAIWGKMLFFSLRWEGGGGHPRFSSLYPNQGKCAGS